MTRQLLTILLLSAPLLLTAQAYSIYKGTVTDSETGESLPYVHIAWSGSQYGTVANEEGAFQIKIPDSNMGDTMVFTFIGYEPYYLPATKELSENKNLNIALAPATHELSMIEVYPVDAKKVMRATIKNIRKNYEKKPFRLKGFFRENGTREDTGGEFLFAEGVIMTHKNKYSKKGKNDYVNLIKGYRKRLQYDLVVDGRLYQLPQVTQGAYIGVRLDIVRDRGFFLSRKKYRDYEYEYERSDVLNGKEIYVIRFYPKKKNKQAWLKGYLYIEKERHAVVKAKYEYTENAKAYYNQLDEAYILQLRGREFEIGYFQYGGKWFLKNARIKSKYTESRTSVPLSINMDFVTTAVETNIKWNKNVPDAKDIIPFDRAFSFNERLEKVGDGFWGSDNILERGHRSDGQRVQDMDSVSFAKAINVAPDLTTVRKPPVLTVKMNGLSSDSLFFAVRPSQLSEDPKTFWLYPKETDESNISLQLDAPAMGVLEYQKREVSVFLHPQDDLVIRLTETPDRKLSIDFGGGGKGDNDFLMQFHRFRQPLLHSIQSKLEEGSATAYQKQVAIYRAACQQFFERSLKKPNSPSPELLELLRDEVVYECARFLLAYPLLTGQSTMPEGFFEYLDGIELNNPKMIGQQNYQEFLKYYLHFQQLQAKKEGQKEVRITLKAQLKLASRFFTGEPLHFLQADLIKQGFLLSAEGAEKEYRKFLKSGAPENLKQQVTIAYSDIKYPRLWDILPPSSLKDARGDAFDPAVLQGKVVYLDIWATWCAPCRQELPFANSLKKRFENEKEVVFLYISLDKDIEKWREFLKQKRLQSPNAVHLIVEREDVNYIYSDLGVKGIPRFMLLDRGGRIIDINAPRPSMGTVGGIIKTELKSNQEGLGF